MFAKVCQYFSIKYYNLFFDTAQAVLREIFVCARFCLTKANCFRIIKGEFKRRNRLAVWRQLPKLIPAGSTPVSCSTNKRHACVPFVFLCYMIPTKYCGESNRTDISFSSPPRDTVITTLSFFRTLNRKSLSLCIRVKYTVRSSRGALSPSRRG